MSESAINVLLIEGDADESSVIKRSFGPCAGEEAAFEVKEASRLSTGSRLLAQERFDAVLLDLSLAQSVGLEGFRRIRAQAREIPILILSGLSDESIAAEAVREGAQEYVIKGTPDYCRLKREVRHAIERKKLSRAVERLLEGDSVAKIVLDGAARVLYANPAAEALFGVKAESLRGRPFEHSLTPAAPSPIKLEVPGAEERSVELAVRGIAWSGGEARLVTLRDVTESGRLRRLEAEASANMRVVEIKNQFMGRISHELRNTLATVKTAVFCLKDGLGGDLSNRQSRLVDMISRNVDRQVRIIDNILDLARFQSGKIKIAPRPVELAQVIDEIAQEFRLKNKAHRFLLELPDELPVVNGDPDLLVQVLRNLLDNAFRFARSRVTVRAAAGGRTEVLLSVIDDGAGIPKERIGELFNQFVQLDRPSGGGYKGTGLGLAICKEIVDGHGGRIWAESAEGEGTSFHLVLPKDGKAGQAGDPGDRGAAEGAVHEPAYYAGGDRSRPSQGLQK
jgi:signal transduction histidine kinase